MRRPLSRARIMRAALDIVDREGLDALTMRRVAAKLDVEAMSLYHHVPNKEAILDGLYDLVVARADLPQGDVTAEEWIRGAADGFRRLAQHHPRAFPLLASRPIPLVDAAAARPIEAGLAAFAKLGMSANASYAAVQAVSIAMLALALVESQLVLDPEPGRESQVANLPEDEFPLLHGVPGLDLDPAAVWSALVDALVRGFAH